MNKKEELFSKQKSRIQWLNEGDKKTKKFHQSTLKHRSKEDGSLVENEEEMAEMFVQFLSLCNPNNQGSFQDPNSLLSM